MKCMARSTVFDCMDWDEFVEYGRQHTEWVDANDMPWHFILPNGIHVTHENDKLYLICGNTETINFTPDRVILFGEAADSWTVLSKSQFEREMIVVNK